MIKYGEHLKNMTVLLLEDDKLIRESTVKILEFFVKHTYGCATIQEAKESYQRTRPSIIIADIELVGENGLFF